ncbi:hypothetical protein GGS21DRAFT_489943 [Xylaria nigripes]|nr:hypothetical protein GGS21DRAFT_489943 [Xylaria nigripes]
MSPSAATGMQFTTEPQESCMATISSTTSNQSNSNDFFGFSSNSLTMGGDQYSSDIMFLSDFDLAGTAENRPSSGTRDETESVSASTPGQFANSSSSAVNAVTTAREQEPHRIARGHRELFELCANLVDETDQLEDIQGRHEMSNGHSFLAMTIQRALSRTSELIDILKGIEAEENQNHPAHTGNNGLVLPQPYPLGQRIDPNACIPTNTLSGHRDISIVATLVTSYLFVLRYWQKLFTHINRVYFGSMSSAHNAPPILPTLLFGGIQVKTNSDTQFTILLETCSSMIQIIEAYLGVTSSSVMKFSETPIETKILILMDPICISLRETMLSHEIFRNSRNDKATHLKEVMESMQIQIYRRRRI